MTIEPSRRRFSETAIATGLLVSGGVGGLVSIARAQRRPRSRIRRMRGQVMSNGQPAKEGTPIRPGDTVVTTGPKSFATFVVGRTPPRAAGAAGSS